MLALHHHGLLRGTELNRHCRVPITHNLRPAQDKSPLRKREKDVKSNKSGKNPKSAAPVKATDDRWSSAHRYLGAIDPAVSGRQPSRHSSIACLPDLGGSLAQILAFNADHFESSRLRFRRRRSRMVPRPADAVIHGAARRRILQPGSGDPMLPEYRWLHSKWRRMDDAISPQRRSPIDDNSIRPAKRHLSRALPIERGSHAGDRNRRRDSIELVSRG